MHDFPPPPQPPSWLWEHREAIAALCMAAVCAGVTLWLVYFYGLRF
jgi:hypothetical protein